MIGWAKILPAGFQKEADAASAFKGCWHCIHHPCHVFSLVSPHPSCQSLLLRLGREETAAQSCLVSAPTESPLPSRYQLLWALSVFFHHIHTEPWPKKYTYHISGLWHVWQKETCHEYWLLQSSPFHDIKDLQTLVLEFWSFLIL